jgi:hypothetical protein
VFIGVEQSGFDEILHCPQYTETRECDCCHVVYSFSYTCGWKLETVIRMAKLRGVGRQHGDVCFRCRELLTHGYYQPRLFV